MAMPPNTPKKPGETAIVSQRAHRNLAPQIILRREFIALSAMAWLRRGLYVTQLWLGPVSRHRTGQRQREGTPPFNPRARRRLDVSPHSAGSFPRHAGTLWIGRRQTRAI